MVFLCIVCRLSLGQVIGSLKLFMSKRVVFQLQIWTTFSSFSTMNNQCPFTSLRCFSMDFDSVYIAILSSVCIYLRRNLMRRCAFCSFWLPSCHVQHSPGFFSQISSECFAEFLDILINFRTTMLLAIF